MALIAIVTGAARGIGAATAIALARRGVTPVLIVREPAAAAEVQHAIAAAGGTCEVIGADVTDLAAVRRAVALTVERHGRIDIAVNNAGVIDPIGALADTDPDAWARNVEVNLVGPYHVCHAVLPSMLAQGNGVIVNVSSGAAHAPREGWTAYCSAKAGLFMMTRGLALEYGERGVAVYGLQPGLIDTGMQASIRQSGINEISRVQRASLASPDRPASVIAWLCCDAPGDLRGLDLSMSDDGLRERAARSVGDPPLHRA